MIQAEYIGLVTVILALVQPSYAGVAETTCTPGNGTNGNTKCQAVNQNAECSTNDNHCACKTDFVLSSSNNSKCVCKTNFVLKPNDNTKCVQKITLVGCSPGDETNGDTKCKKIDANSECPAGATKCACKTGYKGTDTCGKESSANSVRVTQALIAVIFLVVRIGKLS